VWPFSQASSKPGLPPPALYHSDLSPGPFLSGAYLPVLAVPGALLPRLHPMVSGERELAFPEFLPPWGFSSGVCPSRAHSRKAFAPIGLPPFGLCSPWLCTHLGLALDFTPLASSRSYFSQLASWFYPPLGFVMAMPCPKTSHKLPLPCLPHSTPWAFKIISLPKLGLDTLGFHHPRLATLGTASQGLGYLWG
jgi:hypothetical protein